MLFAAPVRSRLVRSAGSCGILKGCCSGYEIEEMPFNTELPLFHRATRVLRGIAGYVGTDMPLQEIVAPKMKLRVPTRQPSCYFF